MTEKEAQAALAQLNLLDLSPVRLASWEEQDERVVVERPRPRKGRGFLAFLNEWLGYHSGTRKIRLDPFGTFAWRQLDGKATVAEVAGRLRGEFGEDIEPAEERLARMMHILYREHLIGYPGIDV